LFNPILTIAADQLKQATLASILKCFYGCLFGLPIACVVYGCPPNKKNRRCFSNAGS